jgi:hypothetical protein
VDGGVAHQVSPRPDHRSVHVALIPGLPPSADHSSRTWPDPDRGRASEFALEDGDPSGVIAVASRTLPSLARRAELGRVAESRREGRLP